MRANVRLVVVLILGVIEIAAAVASIVELNVPVGTYGFLADRAQMTVTEVAPNSSAAQAGVAVGDRIDYPTLPLRGRRFVVLEEEVPGGAAITFVVTHERRPKTVTLRAIAFPGLGAAETVAYALAGLALGLVGLALVLVRPSRMTWAFALVAPPALLPYPLIFWSQESASSGAVAFDAFVGLLYAVQAAAIMIFASRFPNDAPTRVARVVDRLSIPAGLVVATIYSYAYLMLRFSSQPPEQIVPLANVAILATSLAALAALISTYVTTPGGTRSRLVWVIASFVVLIITGALQQVATELTTVGAVVYGVSLAYAASPALVAVAVAYGVMRHRVMDVSFIISRTLVYTALTVCAVATFTLIEYVFGKLLETQRVAVLLEIAAAIALGLSLNALHARIDGFVDRVLFRKRHLAEERLTGVERALGQASSSPAVDAGLVDEPAAAFGLASAAVFRFENDGYRRAHALGWHEGEATSLERDDPLVLQLRADLEAIDPGGMRWPRTDLPRGERQILYAIPIAVGHDVSAIALYGGHTTGEDLDPDERRCLRKLAHSAAAAYDRIAAAHVRRQLERTEAENATLRAVEAKLSELLGQKPQSS
ncbi:MAG TPA: hypothetical protein VGX91_06240 [Candidatus Cybelea sp.]|nr:hypothetical protein [Candidatus Cybelea sp.]